VADDGDAPRSDRRGGIWLHIHGTEQFGLPDLECRADFADVAVASRLIANVTTYLIGGGAAIAPGATLGGPDEPAPVRFAVRSSIRRPEHPFGCLGAWTLILCQRTQPVGTLTS
jgi:hypothetical protein